MKCLNLFFIALVAILPQSVSPELQSLANAERAFAKQALDEGVRNAFIANFADDGIAFRPDPYKPRKFY